MPRQRAFRPASLFPLEERLALSSVLSQAPVALPSGNASAIATVTLPATAFATGKTSTVFGLIVQPDPATGLQPKILSVATADGHRLPMTGNRPFKQGTRGEALTLFTASTPGSVTVKVAGLGGSSGTAQVEAYLPGDGNGDGRVTIDDLVDYGKAYLSGYGQSNYNADADSNRNGHVAQDDGILLERNLSPLTFKHGITVNLALAAPAQIPPDGFSNSGGITQRRYVVVAGHTTPGALVFADTGLGNFTFTGPVLPTNADGNFSFPVDLSTGQTFTNTEFLVIDPYNQRRIKAFPIVKVVR